MSPLDRDLAGGSGTITNRKKPKKKGVVNFVELPVWQHFQVCGEYLKWRTEFKIILQKQGVKWELDQSGSGWVQT
jgi:hypothetical protein